MQFHNRVPLVPDTLFCMTCMPDMYLRVCVQSAAAAAAAAALCFAMLLVLLLSVIVSRMANVAGSLNLMSLFSF